MDPISLSGTAVGIISLGLTTCSAVIEYYSAWKGRDKELDRAISSAEQLSGTLKFLQLLAENFIAVDLSLAAHVQNCIESCHGGILDLKALLDKCRSVGGSQRKREQFLGAVNKAAFPFRQTELRALHAALDRLQLNLQTSLVTFSM